MSGVQRMAREAAEHQYDYRPDPPIVDMSREEAWDIARRLGFKVPGSNVMSIEMRPSEVIVTTAKLNEHGQKYQDPDNPTDVARNVYRFRYRDWAAPFEKTDDHR